MSLRDTSVSGLEGLNMNAVFPFKFDKYIVGFKHSLCNFDRAPTSLFARRSFLTGSLGLATVDAELDTRQNIATVNANWVSPNLGLEVNIAGNSKSAVDTVCVQTRQQIQGLDCDALAAYDVRSRAVNAHIGVSNAVTDVYLSYDTASRNPQVSALRSFRIEFDV